MSEPLAAGRCPEGSRWTVPRASVAATLSSSFLNVGESPTCLGTLSAASVRIVEKTEWEDG